AEAIAIADKIPEQPMQPAAKRELASLLSEAVEGTTDTAAALRGCNKLIVLLPTRAVHLDRDKILAKALLTKGHALMALGRARDAVDAYSTFIRKFGGATNLEIARSVAEGYVNLASMLSDVGRPAQALSVYSDFLRTLARRRDPAIRMAKERALFNRAVTLSK